MVKLARSTSRTRQPATSSAQKPTADITTAPTDPKKRPSTRPKRPISSPPPPPPRQRARPSPKQAPLTDPKPANRPTAGPTNDASPLHRLRTATRKRTQALPGSTSAHVAPARTTPSARLRRRRSAARQQQPVSAPAAAEPHFGASGPGGDGGVVVAATTAAKVDTEGTDAAAAPGGGGADEGGEERRGSLGSKPRRVASAPLPPSRRSARLSGVRAASPAGGEAPTENQSGAGAEGTAVEAVAAVEAAIAKETEIVATRAEEAATTAVGAATTAALVVSCGSVLEQEKAVVGADAEVVVLAAEVGLATSNEGDGPQARSLDSRQSHQQQRENHHEAQQQLNGETVAAVAAFESVAAAATATPPGAPYPSADGGRGDNSGAAAPVAAEDIPEHTADRDEPVAAPRAASGNVVAENVVDVASDNTAATATATATAATAMAAGPSTVTPGCFVSAAAQGSAPTPSQTPRVGMVETAQQRNADGTCPAKAVELTVIQALGLALAMAMTAATRKKAGAVAPAGIAGASLPARTVDYPHVAAVASQRLQLSQPTREVGEGLQTLEGAAAAAAAAARADPMEMEMQAPAWVVVHDGRALAGGQDVTAAATEAEAREAREAVAIEVETGPQQPVKDTPLEVAAVAVVEAEALAHGAAAEEAAAPPPPPPPPPGASTAPSVPLCATCSKPYRNRGNQPSGFFAHGTRAFTCDHCCRVNLRAVGFYGPPGSRSLAETGGRECAECRTRDGPRWRMDPRDLGAYLCTRCHRRHRGPCAGVTAVAAVDKEGDKEEREVAVGRLVEGHEDAQQEGRKGLANALAAATAGGRDEEEEEEEEAVVGVGNARQPSAVEITAGHRRQATAAGPVLDFKRRRQLPLHLRLDAATVSATVAGSRGGGLEPERTKVAKTTPGPVATAAAAAASGGGSGLVDGLPQLLLSRQEAAHLVCAAQGAARAVLGAVWPPDQRQALQEAAHLVLAARGLAGQLLAGAGEGGGVGIGDGGSGGAGGVGGGLPLVVQQEAIRAAGAGAAGESGLAWLAEVAGQVSLVDPGNSGVAAGRRGREEEVAGGGMQRALKRRREQQQQQQDRQHQGGASAGRRDGASGASAASSGSGGVTSSGGGAGQPSPHVGTEVAAAQQLKRKRMQPKVAAAPISAAGTVPSGPSGAPAPASLRKAQGKGSPAAASGGRAGPAATALARGRTPGVAADDLDPLIGPTTTTGGGGKGAAAAGDGGAATEAEEPGRLRTRPRKKAPPSRTAWQ